VRFLPDTVIHLESAVADTLDKAHRTDDLLPGRATSITERIVPSGRCTSLMVRLSSSSPRSMVSMATEKRARSLSPLTRTREHLSNLLHLIGCEGVLLPKRNAFVPYPPFGRPLFRHAFHSDDF
jgi:hypothetical protein